MTRKTIAAAGLAALSLSVYPPNRLPACSADNGELALPP